MRFCLLSLLLWLPAALGQEESEIFRFLDPANLVAAVSSQERCSTLATSRICRAVPWELAHDEGAAEHKDQLYLFLRRDRVKDAADKIFELINPRDVQQVVPLLVLGRDDMLVAISQGQYASIFVIWLERKALVASPVAVWHMMGHEIFAAGRSLPELRAAITAEKNLLAGEQPIFPRHDFLKL